jgi:hypothetical protein
VVGSLDDFHLTVQLVGVSSVQGVVLFSLKCTFFQMYGLFVMGATGFDIVHPH